MYLMNGVFNCNSFSNVLDFKQARCSVCEVENTPLVDNTFEFPAFYAKNP